MNRKSQHPFKAGLFGIGLEAYWPQFPELKERLDKNMETVAQRLGEYGSEVVNLGLVDSPEKALDAGHDFRKADVDIIFLYVTTYALSSTVLPVVQRARVPVILLGHDGPGHLAIAEGKTKVKPLDVYHGKVGEGLSVEMSVKHGPVTLLSVVQSGDGQLRLLIAEGASEPGPILEIGNTNSRYRFPTGARAFVEEWNRHGPAHHCAVGIGHIGSKLSKLASLLGIEAIHVC